MASLAYGKAPYHYCISKYTALTFQYTDHSEYGIQIRFQKIRGRVKMVQKKRAYISTSSKVLN